MNKTKLTIALMGSMAVASAFATTGTEVNASITDYSKASMERTAPGNDSIISKAVAFSVDAKNPTFQKHMANSFVGDKTSKLKVQADTYLASSKEKLERKKDKLVAKEAAAAAAKGWSKIKAWKEVASAKVEQEKQRGRKNAAKAAVEKLGEFNNDGFFQTQYDVVNGIRIDYKNGFNAYNAELVNPSKEILGNAWTAATKFDYVDYTKNIHDFWNVRMNVWTNESEVSKDAKAFNELSNVATIQAISQIKGQDTAASIKDYANANELAFQVTTLGNSEQVVKDLVNNPTANLPLLCENNATAIVNNPSVKSAVELINKLDDENEVKTVITGVLSKVGIDSDYTVVNLKDTLGSMAANVIATVIGNDSVIHVDSDLNLKVEIAAIAAPKVADAISGNSIYKEVVASQNLVVGTETCNYEAVSTSTTRIGKAMMAATNYYADAIAKESGAPVDEATKSKVLMALEGTMYANINKIK